MIPSLGFRANFDSCHKASSTGRDVVVLFDSNDRGTKCWLKPRKRSPRPAEELSPSSLKRPKCIFKEPTQQIVRANFPNTPASPKRPECLAEKPTPQIVPANFWNDSFSPPIEGRRPRRSSGGGVPPFPCLLPTRVAPDESAGSCGARTLVAIKPKRWPMFRSPRGVGSVEQRGIQKKTMSPSIIDGVIIPNALFSTPKTPRN